MKKISILPIVICVIVLGIGFGLLQRIKKQPEEMSASSTEVQEVAQESPEPAVEKKITEDISTVAGEEEPAEQLPAQPDREPIPVVKTESVPVPRNLKVLMGEGENNGFSLRIKEVHSLGKNLSHEEIQTLYALLNRKNNEDFLRPDQLNALKNDVVNALREQEYPPSRLSDNLIAMYNDKGHDKVWRDYCIQHLGHFLKRISSKEKKEAVVATLWKATEETNITIAGTALLAMENNKNDSLIDAGEVAEKALNLCKDSTCGEPAKITALQICAKLGDVRVLSTAREIATSGQSVPLRMSAIAAVGTLGDESDREMLEKYSQSSDIRLRKSAQSALTRLGKQG